MKHFIITATALTIGVTTSVAKTNQNTTKPNIIYILADDLGYGDISALGQKHFKTPNIDKLISQGMFFTQHYSGSTVCAPSRSSLLTGQHTGHTPIRGNLEVKPEGQQPLPADIKTIAQVMKNIGYATGAFGKWGLGVVGSTGDPNKQGFDEFYGYICQRVAHRYYPNHIWHNDKKVVLEGNGWTNTKVYAQDLIQEKTLQFIETNKNKPFFLFVPSLIPHAELLVPEDLIFKSYDGKFKETPFVGRKGADYGPDLDIIMYCSQPKPRATFAAMVARLDLHVGQIMDKVKALGLEKNTIIMFTTDNGSHQEGGADPIFFNSQAGFRGFKRDLYEGGIRIPFVVKWDGQIKPGSQTNHISSFWDMMPTLCDITNQKAPKNIDGVSFLPTLLSTKNQKQHKYLYWEFHELGGRQAVRLGNWKGVKYNALNPDSKIELYDLSIDKKEANDIAAQHPKVVKKIKEIMVDARTPSPIFQFKSVTVKGD